MLFVLCATDLWVRSKGASKTLLIGTFLHAGRCHSGSCRYWTVHTRHEGKHRKNGDTAQSSESSTSNCSQQGSFIAIAPDLYHCCHIDSHLLLSYSRTGYF